MQNQRLKCLHIPVGSIAEPFSLKVIWNLGFSQLMCAADSGPVGWILRWILSGSATNFIVSKWIVFDQNPIDIKPSLAITNYMGVAVTGSKQFKKQCAKHSIFVMGLASIHHKTHVGQPRTFCEGWAFFVMDL